MSTDCLNVKIAGRFMLTKKIGEGAFGEIYIAQCIGSNERVAVKLVSIFSHIHIGTQ